MSNSKKIVYVGGLAEEVDEKILQEAFSPFGETVCQIPLDYVTGIFCTNQLYIYGYILFI